jgi:hypothetical protein
MGFRSVAASEVERVPGYARLGGTPFSAPDYASYPHVALKLLKTFHENTR